MEFTLNGYTEDGALIYTGAVKNVAIEKGIGNTITLTVSYQGGNGKGALALNEIYIKDAKNKKLILNSSSVRVAIEGEETTIEAESKDGYFTAESISLPAGIYTLTFTFLDGEQNEVGSAVKTVFILTGKTTAIKGDITENSNNGTFNVTATDMSVDDSNDYYSIITLNDQAGIFLSEGSAEALAAALNTAKSYENVSIDLNGHDIDLTDKELVIGETATVATRALSEANSSIAINLGNSTISGNGILFSIKEGYSLSLEGCSISSSGATLIETAGTISLKDIELSVDQESSDTPAIKVADGATGEVGILLENVVVDDSIKALVPESSDSVSISTTNVTTTAGASSALTSNHVARVGNMGYETLFSAMAALKDNDELVLLQDINNTIPLPIIENTENLTINMNGHTITSTRHVFVFSGKKSSATITGNGRIEILKGSAYNAIAVYIKARATILNGTYISNSSSPISVGAYSNNPDYTGASLTIKDATVQSEEAAIQIYKDSDLTINGGTFTANNNGVIMGTGSTAANYGSYSITINGGTFNGYVSDSSHSTNRSDGKTPYLAHGIYAPNVGTIHVNGGTFNIYRGAGFVIRGGEFYLGSDAVINLFNENTTVTAGRAGDSARTIPLKKLVIDYGAHYPGWESINYSATSLTEDDIAIIGEPYSAEE